MIVQREKSGFYGFLLGAQGTSCFKPRESPGSSPLRSDGSRDDQAGEAGPVEQNSAEGKSLNTKGLGTVRLPPQWPTPEAARRGARGPNKELLSWQFTKGNKAENSSDWKHSWAKGSPPKKATIEKKRKTLTLCSNLEVAEGGDVGVDEVSEEWEPE